MPETVLLVEAEVERRRTLALALARSGFEVVPVVGLSQGATFAAELEPGIIVISFPEHAVLDLDQPLPSLAELLAHGEIRTATMVLLLVHEAPAVEELPDGVRLLVTGDLPIEEVTRRLQLTLMGRELGLEPDHEVEALVGELSRLSFIGLVGALGRSRFDGRLETDAGQCSFEAGHPVAALAGSARGLKALGRLALRGDRGTFRLVAGTPHLRNLAPISDEELAELLASERRRRTAPSLRAQVAVRSPSELVRAGLSPFEQRIAGLVGESGIRLGSLIDQLPEPDGEVLDALDRLVERELAVIGEPMPDVAVVTDSTCDLAPDLARSHRLEVIPLTVHFGSETYHDGRDLDPRRFYELLSSKSEHPSTNPPPVVSFEETFRSLARDREVFALLLSSDLSLTWAHAREAAKVLPSSTPYRVVDSRQVSLSLGLLALYAARMAERGLHVAEIESRILELSRRITMLFVVDTLEFLARGGRIGRAQAFVGQILGIKPILGLRDGRVVPVDKVRGGKAAQRRIVELLADELDSERPVIGGVGHAAAPVWADRLRSLLLDRFETRELLVGEIGPVVGTHAGPGTVGAALLQPQGDELGLLWPL